MRRSASAAASVEDGDACVTPVPEDGPEQGPLEGEQKVFVQNPADRVARAAALFALESLVVGNVNAAGASDTAHGDRHSGSSGDGPGRVVGVRETTEIVNRHAGPVNRRRGAKRLQNQPRYCRAALFGNPARGSLRQPLRQLAVVRIYPV
jgi:hypothetical protein